MTTLLQINSSLFADQGVSSRMADAFVARFQANNPQGRVIRRNLGSDPLPHLDAARLTAIMTPAAERTPEQQAVADEADGLIRELQEADVLVLGVPMYNFSIPSTLKAWFDHVARSGVTFRYTADGPQGLLKGKRAYVFAARGGFYKETPNDTQTPFVKTFLGFLGIEEVEFIYAEGLNIDQQQKETSLNQANQQIERLATV